MTQYGENGFVPTVERVRRYGYTLVMETIDGREESDIIGEPGEPLKRQAELVTEEQQEQLAIYERN